MNNNDSYRKRMRKALLVMPLIVIPFLTLAFWAMGGGKEAAQVQNSSSGLNFQLPDAHLKDDKSENKMSFYDEMEKNSLDYWKHQKSEGTDTAGAFRDTTSFLSSQNQKGSFSEGSSSLKQLGSADEKEQEIYRKLAQINGQLNQSSVSTKSYHETLGKVSQLPVSGASNKDDIQRLDQLMSHSTEGETSDDSEINHLNTMMDKILDIQHPQRIRDRMQQMQTQKQQRHFQVSKEPATSSISLLDTSVHQDSGTAGFWGLEEGFKSTEQNTIEAVVHQNQVLVDGAIIKLRLLSDVYINEKLVPKESFVYGTVSLNGERLRVTITSIRCQDVLLPVQLEVYDLDGLPGINIPGAMTRDVAKSSVDNAAQMLEVTSLDPSLKAQAASAGLSAVKSLLSKKAKLVKVTIKAGYKVLLKDKQEQ
ncbi:MAG TPA: conjugative transposon protein TraM [Flavisolibacter sp.]|nr:conjugative transposon protein TraM [Flavisolibacter sp.]